jgi:histidinol dehydrogenase
MLAIPAKLAGCREVILCSPPDKNGNIHPAILYTAALCGVTKIFKAGGVQAIAAMAYGTDSIPKVFKIFGPGNQYVTLAKQLVQQDGLAIDMPAGPSKF